MARPGNIGDDFVWSPAEGCRPAGHPLHSVSGRCVRCRLVQAGAGSCRSSTTIRTLVRVAVGMGPTECSGPQISLQQRLGAGQPRALPHLTGADHAAWAGCNEQAPCYCGKIP